MTDINTDDYYSAGYFLIRKNKRQSWLDEPTGLIPDEVVRLEAEFCLKFHLSWTWEPGDKTEELEFGIDGSKWEQFKAWCAAYHEHEVEVWGMFRSVYAARRVIALFIPKAKQDGLMIVGVGLHKSRIEDWQEPYDQEGVKGRILQQQPMEHGGQILGFDIAGYDYHDFDHSWLSHGHHRDVFNELGIRPCKFGLLQIREEAVLSRDYTNAHDGRTYEYWLLAEYHY